MKILSNMTNQEKISTNSPLDELLDGGIEKRTITQVYGPPGVGKTNICLNIAIGVAKRGKKVVYIDTEGGISVDRIRQISGEDFDTELNLGYLQTVQMLNSLYWTLLLHCLGLKMIAQNPIF